MILATTLDHDNPAVTLYMPCFPDLFPIVTDVDVVTVPTVGDHLRTQHHTVRSSLASMEGPSADVQRSPVH